MGPAPTVGLETATRPTAAVWHAATLGHDSAAASLLWMHAVVHFSTSESPDPEWIRAAVSTCADLDPLVIQSVQFVFESNLFRLYKAERRVMDFQILLTGIDLQILAIRCGTLQQTILDH